MRNSYIVAIVFAIIFVLLLMGILPPGVSIMTSVPAGHTGILTTYGKVENTYLPSGLHFKKPWQKIVVMDNRIQTMRIASGTNKSTTSDTAETKDQQLVPVFEFEIQYQLNAQKSYEVYRNYGTDYEKTLLTSNALQFIKEVFAGYNADQIVTNKSQIPDEIRAKLSEVTEPMGINIIRVNMVTYDFSTEYTQILEQRALLSAQLQNNRLEQQNKTIAAQTEYEVAVKAAEKDAETKRIQSENENQIAIARAEAKAQKDKIDAENSAYVTRTQAEAEKEARIAKADAERAELEAKSAGLNDYVIQQQWIEKWDGKLIPNFGGTGNGINFTDWTNIIKDYVKPAADDSAQD